MICIEKIQWVLIYSLVWYIFSSNIKDGFNYTMVYLGSRKYGIIGMIQFLISSSTSWRLIILSYVDANHDTLGSY